MRARAVASRKSARKCGSSAASSGIVRRNEIRAELHAALAASDLGAYVVDCSPNRPGLHLICSKVDVEAICRVVDALDWTWRRVDGPRLPGSSRQINWSFAGGVRLWLTAPGVGATAHTYRSAGAILRSLPPASPGLQEAPGWAAALTTIVRAGPAALERSPGLLAEVQETWAGDPRLLAVAADARLGEAVSKAVTLTDPAEAATVIPDLRRSRVLDAALRRVPRRMKNALVRPTRCRFDGLELLAGPHVFLPRVESEHLVHAAIAHFDELPPGPKRGIDVGTGVGAIALAVCARMPSARMVGLDLMRDPIRWAHRNARRLGLAHAATFAVSDLLSQVPKPWRSGVDLVVGNIPCVAAADFGGAADTGAVGYVGEGGDGLGLHRRLLADARQVLSVDGAVCLQLRPDQLEPLSAEAERGGWQVRSTDVASSVAFATLRRQPT